MLECQDTNWCQVPVMAQGYRNRRLALECLQGCVADTMMPPLTKSQMCRCLEFLPARSPLRQAITPQLHDYVESQLLVCGAAQPVQEIQFQLITGIGSKSLGCRSSGNGEAIRMAESKSALFMSQYMIPLESCRRAGGLKFNFNTK